MDTLDLTGYTLDGLLLGIMRLTHAVHEATSLDQADDLREQRSLLLDEVKRRAEPPTGRPVAYVGDRVNLTAAALRLEVECGEGDECAHAAQSVWAALWDDLNVSEAMETAAALTATPATSPDVYAYTPPF